MVLKAVKQSLSKAPVGKTHCQAVAGLCAKLVLEKFAEEGLVEDIGFAVVFFRKMRQL